MMKCTGGTHSATTSSNMRVRNVKVFGLAGICSYRLNFGSGCSTDEERKL